MLEIREVGFWYPECVDEGVLKKRVLWDILATVELLYVGDIGCLEHRFAERIELVFRAVEEAELFC